MQTNQIHDAAMIGTYNEAYTGELHTPEGLFQSIPQAVQPEQVICAASEIVQRLGGVMGLVTTNGGALNGQDMEQALLGVEAMIDQLRVVLKHPTTSNSTTEASQ